MARLSDQTRFDRIRRKKKVSVDDVKWLIQEVEKTPCPECKGTGRMCTGEMYMGGPETYDTCTECKGHVGKKYGKRKKKRAKS